MIYYLKNSLLLLIFLLFFTGKTAFAVSFSDSLLLSLIDYIDLIVDAEGEGDFTTVQAAIDAVPENNSTEVIIFIKNGIYQEKIIVPDNKPFITLIGEDADSTILTYNDYSGKVVNNVTLGTSTSYSFAADADDFRAMNLSFENSSGDVGQAVALRTHGDRQVYLHCRMLGYQDTYYTWGNDRLFNKDCLIEGAIDYIFGRSTSIFDSCQIHSLRDKSYITAASTDEGVKFGYIFKHCKLTAAPYKTQIYLGRPWKPYAQSVFYECDEGDFIDASGWSEWSGTENHLSCYYAEFNCSGKGSDTSNRAAWSHQLNSQEALEYNMANIYSTSTDPVHYTDEWNPRMEEDSVYRIVRENTVPFLDSRYQRVWINSIKYNDIPISEVSSENYNYVIELPEGSTKLPKVSVTSTCPGVYTNINYASSLPGSATITATSGDRSQNLTYKVFFSINQAYTNASLKSLKYNNKYFPDFQTDITEYNVVLPFGTNAIPSIQAVPEIADAKVEVTYPDTLPGSALIRVRAMDQISEKVYIMNFTLAFPDGIIENHFSSIRIVNPFSHYLKISISSSENTPVQLQLVSISGKRVLNHVIQPSLHENQLFEIQTDRLSKGIYIYKLFIGEKCFEGKVIKVN